MRDALIVARVATSDPSAIVVADCVVGVVAVRVATGKPADGADACPNTLGNTIVCTDA